MTRSYRLNRKPAQADDSKRFEESSDAAVAENSAQESWSVPAADLHPQDMSNSIFPPLKAGSDGGYGHSADSGAPEATQPSSRAPLSQHDILLLSTVPAQDSLARRAASGLDPRIATSTDELCAHLEAERFKLVVVECAKGATDMVRLALETHRQLPTDDQTALIAFTPTPEGALDLLRYTPTATAFAFLAAQEHQLRAHFLKLING